MNNEDYVNYFLSKDVIKESGVNHETGEVLYSFTPKMKDIMPEMYREHLNFINAEIMFFWENGFVDMNLLEDDPVVSLTDKAFDSNEISQLPDDKKWSLFELKRMLSRP